MTSFIMVIVLIKKSNNVVIYFKLYDDNLCTAPDSKIKFGAEVVSPILNEVSCVFMHGCIYKKRHDDST
jgi:hypothetical protein